MYFHRVKLQINTFGIFRMTSKETSRSGYNLFLKESWTTIENRLYGECKRILSETSSSNPVLPG